MESAAGIEPSEAGSEKRAADGDGLVMEDTSPPKRLKGGWNDRRSVVGDVKKVAEIVLVLAAIGKMRGGRGPTEAERELMAEARSRLAEICEAFAPKDVFPIDAFGCLIDDLGFNKLKEQSLGFRPPKMSIAEKLLVTKRKMEKAENFSLSSTPLSSQRLQGNSISAVESSGLHPIRMSQSDKSSRMSTPSGGLQSVSPLGHGSNPTSLPYQLPSSEIRPVVTSALPSSHLVSAAVPRVDRPHLRSEGRSNGSSHVPQVPANYSANSSLKTPMWSMQPHSVSSAKIVSDIKAPVNMPVKVEASAGVKSESVPQVTSGTFNAHKIGPPSQRPTNVQSHARNTHAEIGKIVQKLLRPAVSECPTWIPPSRDYMCKPVTCQMCMSTITDVDSVLICDACEKGYHLKCLQTTNQRGVPKGEWHCGKCLSLSNGKPLPPKYGRVMRNMNTSKASSNSAAIPSTSSKTVPSTSSKKIDASNETGQLKVTVNGSTSMLSVPAGAVGNNHVNQVSDPVQEDSKGVLENDSISTRREMDDNVSSGTCQSNSVKTSSSVSLSSLNSTVVKKPDEKPVEQKSNSQAKLEIVSNLSAKTPIMLSAQDGNSGPPNSEASSLNQSLENLVMNRDSNEPHGDDISNNNSNIRKEKEPIRGNPSEISSSSEFLTQGKSDGLHPVSWVGDPVQVLDEKIYYATCCINGRVYKVMDHALIRFDNDKFIPSKIQAMWEDKNTTTKWIQINRCYFPGDLPQAVGRPCGLESSEVCESTCGRILMAGLIESPCKVLPPRKFAEENEYRRRSETQLNDTLPPLYLCKWIYDEPKGLFRDISC